MDPLACQFEKNDTNQLCLVVTKLQWRNKQFYINLKFKKKKKIVPNVELPWILLIFLPSVSWEVLVLIMGAWTVDLLKTDKGLISEYAAVTLIPCFVSIPTRPGQDQPSCAQGSPRTPIWALPLTLSDLMQIYFGDLQVHSQCSAVP